MIFKRFKRFLQRYWNKNKVGDEDERFHTINAENNAISELRKTDPMRPIPVPLPIWSGPSKAEMTN